MKLDVHRGLVTLSVDTLDEKELIKQLAEAKAYSEKSYVVWEKDPVTQRKKKRFDKARVYHQVFKTDSNFRRISYSIGLHDPVLSTLLRLGYDPKDLIIPLKTPLLISEKWLEILRDGQKEILMKLLQRNNGVAKLYTGLGKTELQLALIESYLTWHPDRYALVLVPTNSIRDEWVLRMKKWEVDSKRIHIVNPVGLMRRNNKKELINKIQSPGIVTADEVHHIKAASWIKLINSLTKVQYIYGFSATPEVTGEDIHESTNLLSRVYPLVAYQLAALMGPVRVSRTPNEKEVEIRLIRGPIAEVPVSLDESHYIEAIEKTLLSPVLVNILTKDLIKTANMKLYIPVITKDTGTRLAAMFASKGIGTIYWDSGKAIFLKGKELTALNGLDDIKKFISDNTARVLITTSLSYEGVDLPALNAVLLAHGKNDRMILQPLGRSSRGDHIRIYLPWDTNNPVAISQTSQRLRVIARDYKIAKRTTVEIPM